MRIALVIFSGMLFSMSVFASKPKNIIFILADDLGWNDTSIYQPNQFYETPSIDALAQKGMAFTNAFSNSPLCSPTRATILTGMVPGKHGILNPNINTQEVRLVATVRENGPTNQKSTTPLTATRLDNNLPTLAKVLQQNNYQTAHFGKWHLGSTPYSALEHGFDVDIPHYSGSGPEGGYLAPWSFAPNLSPTEPNEHIDIRLAKEARDWILRAQESGPFFVNFWPFSVHAPFNAQPESVEYFRNKRTPFNSQRSGTYAAMVKHFDDAIGILWQALVDAGIEDDTIIVFTSDNGGNMYDVLGQIHPTSNFPLRGGKATQYSGGNRVPTFIIWPGLTQENTLSAVPIQSADFYPTLLNGLDISWPIAHEVDGQDIRPILKGEAFERKPIITYYPTAPRVPDWLPPSATVVDEDWKLIKTFYYGQRQTDRFELFNVKQDVDESENLAESHPDEVARLDQLLTQYFEDNSVPLPQENPRYRDGAFNYANIGKPADRFTLPEEKVRSNLAVKFTQSSEQVNAGEQVSISWQLEGASNAARVDFRQFMGPEVTLSNATQRVTFEAPEVFTEQYVGFAFIIKDGTKTLRQQVAVAVIPTASTPTIAPAQDIISAEKGSVATIGFEVMDKNKDRLSVRLESPELGIDQQIDATTNQHSVSIPQNFSGNTANVTLHVSDGANTSSTTVVVNVTEVSTPPPPAPAPTPNVTPSPSSGGGSVFWLLSFLFIGVCWQLLTANKKA